MTANGLHATSRQLVYALPILMGGVEYLLRVALGQSDSDAFFPSSLAAGGIALFIALTDLTSLSASESGVASGRRGWLDQRLAQAGVWAAVIGTAGWLYLVLASLSESVKDVIPYHPFWWAIAYYGAGVVLNEWKARAT
jgi:hypothetical protein